MTEMTEMTITQIMLYQSFWSKIYERNYIYRIQSGIKKDEENDF